MSEIAGASDFNLSNSFDDRGSTNIFFSGFSTAAGDWRVGGHCSNWSVTGGDLGTTGIRNAVSESILRSSFGSYHASTKGVVYFEQ
jgi:hypothetical protein